MEITKKLVKLNKPFRAVVFPTIITTVGEESMENHTNDEIDRIIPNMPNFIEVAQDVWLPETYLKFSESIANFEIRESDVIVASYPRSGTTWTQEMVWLIANDLDFKGAETELGDRFPFYEICAITDPEDLEKLLTLKPASIEYIREQKSPRFIKTHLPFSLLPEQIRNGSKSPKIIYVMRNPKDACLSYYYQNRLFRGWSGTLEDFAKLFLSDKALYGSFWKHILGYWEHKNSPNFHFVKFEDMKKDLAAVIKDVGNFFGKELTCEQVQQLCDHLSFESMKNNNAVNRQELIATRKRLNMIKGDGTFIRSGKVGNYKEEFSSQLIEQFDTWTKKNIEGTDFEQHYNYSL